VELVVFAIGLAFSGLIVGGLARFAVPGPDPLSIWKTILLGIAGSIVGGVLGGIGLAALGRGPVEGVGADMFMGFFFALGGAVLLLVLYRRFVQGRPITGPDAFRPPDRGV
jgi:uncharacterized membrane protein YeaQ/YmgE (transglycosylase-associated protein family)